MANKKGPSCFVIGLHVFGDASQVSLSGGMYESLFEDSVSTVYGRRTIWQLGVVLLCD